MKKLTDYELAHPVIDAMIRVRGKEVQDSLFRTVDEINAKAKRKNEKKATSPPDPSNSKAESDP